MLMSFCSLQQIRITNFWFLVCGRVLFFTIALLAISSNIFAQESEQAAPEVKPEKVKVGIFVSLYSAKGPSWWIGGEIGFGHVDAARGFLDTNKYELFALVDPGTQNNPDIQAQLKRYPFSSVVLNAARVEDLKKVDVMVSGNWQVNIGWDVLDAITEAVKSGVHLVNQEHFGLIRPAYATGHEATSATWASHMNVDIKNNPEEVRRYKERMTELFGLEDPQFVWHLPYMQWMVNNKNPIFNHLKDDEVCSAMGINGLVGKMVDGSRLPFEAIEGSIEDKWDGRTVYKSEIDPFSIYRCGKGVTINMSIVGDFNTLGFRDRDWLTKKCVDWLTSGQEIKDEDMTRPPLKQQQTKP